MTVNTNWMATDNAEGIDLNNVQTSINVAVDPSVPAARARVGRRVQGAGGSEWMFVQASSTVTAYNVVAIDSNGQARNASLVQLASFQYSFGIAQFTPNQLGTTVSVGSASGGVCNAGDYFWALMRAAFGGQANFLTTAAIGAPRVYITSTNPGVLTTSATSIYFPGLYVVGTLATISVASNIEIVMSGYLVPVSVTA